MAMLIELKFFFWDYKTIGLIRHEENPATFFFRKFRWKNCSLPLMSASGITLCHIFSWIIYSNMKQKHESDNKIKKVNFYYFWLIDSGIENSQRLMKTCKLTISLPVKTSKNVFQDIGKWSGYCDWISLSLACLFASDN